MSKVNKVLLIIGTACVVLGLIVGVTAFAFARFDYQALSTTKPYEEYAFQAKSADIDTIEFSGVSDNVQVQYGPVKTIEIAYWANGDYYYTLSEDSGHTLSMEFDQGRNWFGLNFGLDLAFDAFATRDVVITLPKSFEGSLNIKTVSGNTFIDAPSSLESIDIDTISGNVDFNCEDIESISINGVSGWVDFSCKATGRIKIDTISGNVDFSSGSINQLKFNSLSGNIEGRVADDVADYTIKADTLSGDLDIPRTANKAKNSMDFDTTSGNVRIDFSN